MHFWPALTVISRTTSLTNSPNSGIAGVTSGASTEQLSESVSARKRTASRTITGWVLRRDAVAAEPVNDTASWQLR